MPEAITGTPWVVVEQPKGSLADGITNVELHRMAVPEYGAPNERFVRLHELGHAKLTPSNAKPALLAKRYECKEADIQIVEDLRIHSVLVNCTNNGNGGPLFDSDVQPHTEAEYLNRGVKMADYTRTPSEHLELLTWMALQHHTTYGGQDMAQHGCLTNRYRQAMGTYRGTMLSNTSANTSAMDTVDLVRRLSGKIAQDVAKELAGKRHGSRKIRDFKSTCKAAKLLRRLLSETSEMLPDNWDDEYDRHLARSIISTDPGDGEWGELVSVDTLNLCVPHRPKEQPIKTRQAVPMGARLGHIRRLITDGRAFCRTRKKPLQGGTVLIDASGSMELPTSEIMRYLDQAPSSTIAMYSANSKRGKITIIAKNGRLATERDISDRRNAVGGGNVIDGHALDWLAKQAEPRVWICDGYVTGKSDGSHANLTREAAIKAKRGNIKRYETIEEAIRATSS